MNLILQILIWGAVTGVIHFIIASALYQNPFIAKIYTDAGELPGVKKWPDKKKYIISMVLGTQVEVFILTAAFLFIRQYLPFSSWSNTLILGAFFSGIRVYPRFWNMWIQSTYPNNLLVVEFINGILSTFTIVITLNLLPIR